MNRNFIMAHFTIDQDGIIRTPGKYEGEPLYVPYFWAQNDSADDQVQDEGVPVDIFKVTADDRLSFPELADIAVVTLWEREDGFVCSRQFTAREWSDFGASDHGCED